MRTTLTLDDGLAAELKAKASRSGRTFKTVVNETLRAGLSRQRRPAPRRYRLKPRSLGGVLVPVDLDKALRLADALEDEGVARKLELRK